MVYNSGIMPDTYSRYTQRAVTLFIHCGGKYLFLKRSMAKKVDPGLVNGVGGRVEPNENFLEAALREAKEETGYEIRTSNVSLAGVMTLEGGYEVDWVLCLFKINVETMEIPIGNKTEDGELIWLDKQEIMANRSQLVEDIGYCIDDIIEGKDIFFRTCRFNKELKIENSNVGKISR